MWIDKNQNQIQDDDEPGLPLVPVIATLISSGVGGTSGTQVNFRTDGVGKYSVPQLEPGTWQVQATLSTDALQKTFDTDSVTKSSVIDWIAEANVPVNSFGVADFAAEGNSALKLAVEVPEECVRSESVEIAWAGTDLALNTKDDAVFKVQLQEKEAVIKRIPYGKYSVTPICTSGVKMVGQQIVLNKKQTRSVNIMASVLPATGQQSSRILIQAGLALMLVGLVLAKRRKVTA